jgi:AcrR family transcriptional regulator
MGRPRADPALPAAGERLLAAAEAEFGRAGFATARLQDVAAAAGMTRASLLHHFASKESLYAAVVRRGFDALGGLLAAAMSAPRSFPRRVEELVRGFEAFLDGRPALARLVVRELLDEHGPGRAILLDEVVPLLDQVERFLRREGGRRAVPARTSLLAVCADVLLRGAVDPELRRRLWGRQGADLRLARRLLLEER